MKARPLADFPEGMVKRFINKCSMVGHGGCWIWTGNHWKGYGRCYPWGRKGPRIQAHRVSWAIKNSRDPGDLEIDHECRVTDCVNWDHLVAVTPQVNRARRQPRG